MSIYLHETKGKLVVSGLVKKTQDHRIPSEERIGMLWKGLSDSLVASKTVLSSAERNLVLTSLQGLGLHAQDLTGMSEIVALIQDPGVLGGGRKRLILEQMGLPEGEDYSSGVFRLLNKKGSTIAIFKPSLKRAENELAVRGIAVMLGLSDCVVPGIFCTLQGSFPLPKEEKNSEICEESHIVQTEEKELVFDGLELSKETEKKEKPTSSMILDGEELARELCEGLIKCNVEESISPRAPKGVFEISEELYCGMVKATIVNQKNRRQLLSGILEPFVSSDPNPASKIFQFVKMTILAAATGFRDAKSDGYVNGVWIDYEENMPASLDISMASFEDINTNVAQLHLPYLESELTRIKLKGMDLVNLQAVVGRWDLDDILKKVSALTMHFYDRDAEAQALTKKSSAKEKPKALQEEEEEVDEEIDEILHGRSELSEKKESKSEMSCSSFDIHDLESTPERKKLFPSRNVIEESKETNDQVKVYLPSQIQAFEERLRSVHAAILQANLEEGISALDIVFAADPLYMAHYQAIIDPSKKFAGTRREEQAFRALALNPFLRLGSASPICMHSPISSPPISTPAFRSAQGSPSSSCMGTPPSASPTVMSPRSLLSTSTTSPISRTPSFQLLQLTSRGLATSPPPTSPGSPLSLKNTTATTRQGISRVFSLSRNSRQGASTTTTTTATVRTFPTEQPH
jgi:hypothetical protein